jgi:transposase
MANKYVKRAKISEAKFRELVRLFTLDLTATQMAELSGLNRNTVNRYVKGIRRRIAEHCNREAPFSTERMGLEQGEKDQNFMLGILENGGAIYTTLFEDKQLEAVSSLFRAIDLVIDLEDETQRWLIDESEEQEDYSSKVNTIDGFRGYVKTRVEKFKGLHRKTWFLHLKESEFRYNNPKSELYQLVLKIIRNNPLF